MADRAGHTLALPTSVSSARARQTSTFVARVAADWASLAGRWDVAPAFAFQNRVWIESWYEAMERTPGRTPLPVEVLDDEGRLAALLPLVRIERNGRSEITFADEELTDYNAPLLGPAAPADAAGAKRLWRSVRAVLPAADVFSLRKSPNHIGSAVNPFSLLPGAGLCAVNGNVVYVGESFEEYHRGLGKAVRGEFDRSWRVFLRNPGARFNHITDPDEASRVLAVADAQQRARFDELGTHFILDHPEPAAFYRALAARGIASGFTYVSTLECDAGIIATLVGFVQGDRVFVTRLTNAGKAWSNCSPGRLILHRSMMDLHAKGVRAFDFTIGDYDYKRRFKVEPVPLFDFVVPLSWKGAVPAVRARAAAGLRKYPALNAQVRRVIRV